MRAIAHSPITQRWGWLDDDFDQIFDGFFRPMQLVKETQNRDLIPAVDVSESDEEYLVRTELPGVRKEDIDVMLEDGVLTITAETKSETDEKRGERIIRQERRCGKYMRSLRLGSEIDDKAVKADYKDGVLELVLPKAEKIKPKKIAVGVG